MLIVRTVLWVLALVALIAFSLANWDVDLTVKVWPTIVMDTNVPKLVIVVYLLGVVPMWLLARAVRWRKDRRITTLEAQLGRAAENDRAEVQNALARKDAERAIFDAEASGASTYTPTPRK